MPTPPPTPPNCDSSSATAAAMFPRDDGNNNIAAVNVDPPPRRSILRIRAHDDAVCSGGSSKINAATGSGDGVDDALGASHCCLKKKKKMGAPGGVRWAPDVAVRDAWRDFLEDEHEETVQTRGRAMTMDGEELLLFAMPDLYAEAAPEPEPEPEPAPEPRLRELKAYRNAVVESPRVFSRAAIFAIEDDGNSVANNNRGGNGMRGDGYGGCERGTGMASSWGYYDGMGMREITGNGRRILDRSKARLSINITSEEDEEGGESDYESEEENEENGHRWEYYDGSMASLRKVVFSSTVNVSPFGTSIQKSVTSPKSRSTSTKKLYHPAATSPLPAQWMTAADLDGILSSTSGWKHGSGVDGSRAGRLSGGRARGSRATTSQLQSGWDCGYGGFGGFEKQGWFEEEFQAGSRSGQSKEEIGHDGTGDDVGDGDTGGSDFAAQLFALAKAECASALLFKRAYLNWKS